jgi:methylmalonyl-CoA/ethylmalonyl-CoA epimerase
MNPVAPQPSFRPLHLGVAVRDLKAALAFYEQALGFKLLHGPVDDPIQQVTVCFLGAAEGGEIELIVPLGDQSPVARYLAREIGAYHVCYEVPDIEQALNTVRAQGCLIVSPPVTATAFGGRRIAWFYTPTKQLIEILEAQPSSKQTTTHEH